MIQRIKDWWNQRMFRQTLVHWRRIDWMMRELKAMAPIEQPSSIHPVPTTFYARRSS